MGRSKRRPTVVRVAQNIYDDPRFFDRYAELDRSRRGLDGAPEWPSLRALLPPIAGSRVLDLGSGYGWFARWAATNGAAEVRGIELSERMLDRARADTPAALPVEFVQADLETLDTLDTVTNAGGVAGYDLVYSSLTLHYVAALDELLAAVHRLLVPGAAFVFSTEHPVLTGATTPRFIGGDHGPAWPLDRYCDEGPVVVDWLGAGVVKHHRTIATYLRGLRHAGLELIDLVEWSPSAAQVADEPSWEVERRRPYFLLVSARRP